jgi:Flp pilus assembly protein TadG
LVELALTIPVLLLLLVGVVEVGNALNAYLTVVDAGRDGARLGSKGSASDDEIKNLVVTETGRLPNDVQPGDITVERNVLPGAPTRSSIRVTVCYNHSPILPVPLVIPNPLRMCSTTTMPKVS